MANNRGHEAVLTRAEIANDRGKLRNNENQEEGEHRDRNQQQEDRIAQGGGDARAQLFLFDPLLGDGVERAIERPGRLCGAHDGDNLRQIGSWVRAQSVGEIHTRRDRGAQLRDETGHQSANIIDEEAQAFV